jgi:nicotinate-nucleotide pyrophosphorylase (carboxylating)
MQIREKDYIPQIRRALKEDQARNDVTSLAVFGRRGKKSVGEFIAKEDCVISGLKIALETFKIVSKNTKVKALVKDGDKVKKGDKIAIVKGNMTHLLKAERVSLNFLQHLSGVATLTNQYLQTIKPHQAKILDTRKTIPGFRLLEKKAVKDGGGHNHRMDLSDMFLIKDNHIAACGGVAKAIQRVKLYSLIKFKKRKIEVEVKNLKELKEALNEGVDIILLDNMKITDIKKAVKLTGNQCELEVSGGVNLDTVKKIAATGVDRISIGRLTHSVKACDITFLI